MRSRRIAVVVVLLAVLVGMFVHYGAAAAENGHDATQVSARQLAAGEERIGERLYFWGRVVNTTDNGFFATSSGRTLSVEGANASVEPGDAVQVYGTIRSDSAVLAERVVVSERGHLQYLYAVSIIGGALAAALFSRRWRIQWSSLQFTPRENDD